MNFFEGLTWKDKLYMIGGGTLACAFGWFILVLLLSIGAE